MIALALTCLVATTAPVVAEQGPPTVAVLPLRAKPGVTAKQAAGTTALLRKALAAADFLKLVAERKEDEKAADACGVQAPCLARAAFQRGADLLAGGTVSSAKDGLRIELTVVAPDRDEPVRTAAATLVGYDLDSVLDRLLREAFVPATLAGALSIEGDCEGAQVLVDGKVAGTCPLAGPVLGLVEGTHTVEVLKPGFQRFRRNVDIRYREVGALKVVLLRDLPTTDGPAADGPSIPWGPIGLVAGGGALVVTGAVLGALSLRDSLDVEARAKAQQLVFPRDTGLMQRGALLAVSADVAYVAGAAALAGGAVWWLLSSSSPSQPAAPAPAALAAPAEGAPTEDELAPALEDLR